MSIGTLLAIGVGLGFAVIRATGYVLRRTGKLYGPVRLNVHKLMSVVLLGFIAWSAVATDKSGPVTAATWAVVGFSVSA